MLRGVDLIYRIIKRKKERHPSMRYKNEHYICITYITVFL